jgi:hypothetical protein
MPKPKKIANEDRTTIKVGRDAAAKIRAIAFFEQLPSVDLYTYVLEEWATGYEKTIGRKVEELHAGIAPPSSREGRALAQLRRQAKKPEH